MTKKDKREANQHNLEWLKLSTTKYCERFLEAPAQRTQEAQAIPQFKNISPQSN